MQLAFRQGYQGIRNSKKGSCTLIIDNLLSYCSERSEED